MQRFCYAADLKDDDNLIEEYERWHRSENSWPEINESITGSGITRMEIYRVGNRLFMIVEADDDFDPRKKEDMDATNPIVQRWENLMWQYQQPLPWAAIGEKWVKMEKIFDLQATSSITN
ncbi:L-rhamnose mutarotase [Filimonas effusa]|uniref:L-rhamnose mutarotase n=1 Tax=Filimonas effusa TaxID=2508721 RepID=A0A4Q1D8C7_9BACT|nr:L-rhamnose mutarotase [Filimonas effusa]RXK85531.1 L-rhamnose mutarotase [Filimonas effusa]